jgi:uncharacterized SAM-binding protein YcdF (DUF218 family)
MYIFLSKLIPPFIYPLGLIILLVLVALIFARKQRLQRAALILALVLLLVGSNRWTAVLLSRSLEWRYLPPAELSEASLSARQTPLAEVIVVLGGATDSHLAPRPTVEVNGAGDRVLYAAYLYKMGAADHLLLSGGRIDWLETGDSPAEDMAALLKLMEVPEEALWLERESRNTAENASAAHAFLAPKGIQRIILVTSAEHMPRAVGLFEGQGFEVIPAPTDYSITQAEWQDLTQPDLLSQFLNLIPSASNLSSVTSSLKEYLGILVNSIRH